jgi:hypothetical protein
MAGALVPEQVIQQLAGLHLGPQQVCILPQLMAILLFWLASLMAAHNYTCLHFLCWPTPSCMAFCAVFMWLLLLHLHSMMPAPLVSGTLSATTCAGCCSPCMCPD